MDRAERIEIRSYNMDRAYGATKWFELMAIQGALGLWFYSNNLKINNSISEF